MNCYHRRASGCRMCIHGLFKSFQFKTLYPMCACLLPYIPEIVKALGTALAIKAGSSGESYCAPTLHCPTCPSLQCGSGLSASTDICGGSWLSTIVSLVLGACVGISGTLWYLTFQSPSQAREPRKSAARIALEKS